MALLIGEMMSRLNGSARYSPPFPRGGQSVLFSIDSMDVPGAPIQLDIVVEHKDESATTGTTWGAFTAITTTGVKTLSLAGAKEMIRFKFTISGGLTPEVYDTFLFNMLAPNWMP
jgi:hypothetical protein